MTWGTALQVNTQVVPKQTHAVSALGMGAAHTQGDAKHPIAPPL